MSVVWRKNYKLDHYHNGMPDKCWFCDNNIWDEKQKGQDVLYKHAIMWSGMNGDIYLHPKCAEHLATRLIHDVVNSGMSTLARQNRVSDE